jgi:hypothetical protein
MTGETIIDRDGRIRMPGRKISKLTKDRYGLYLPTGLNELWEELRLRRARLLVEIQIIGFGSVTSRAEPVSGKIRDASLALSLGGQERGQNKDESGG